MNLLVNIKNYSCGSRLVPPPPPSAAPRRIPTQASAPVFSSIQSPRISYISIIISSTKGTYISSSAGNPAAHMVLTCTSQHRHPRAAAIMYCCALSSDESSVTPLHAALLLCSLQKHVRHALLFTPARSIKHVIHAPGF